jgi:acetolactate synthase-1/3 small subunit
MTIVLQGQDGVVEQARRQLEDLVPVWAVLDYTQAPLVQRELLLAKISILGPEYFEELLAHHQEMSEQQESMTLEERETQMSQSRGEYHPSRLEKSQALRHKHQHLDAITYLTHQFGGKVLDISNNNCIVELSAKPSRIDSFMKLIQPFGILESARTGESCWSWYLRRSLTRLLQVSWHFQEVHSRVRMILKRRRLKMLLTRAFCLLVKDGQIRTEFRRPWSWTA